MAERISNIRDKVLPNTLAGEPDIATGRVRVAMILGAALVLLLMVWSTWNQVRIQLEREKELAIWVTASAATRLSDELREVDYRLRDFVKQERDLLAVVAATPDSPELGDSLWSLLQLVFPEASAALVLDAQSGRVTSLGDETSEECLVQLRRYLRDAAPNLHISGTGSPESADFLAAWYDEAQPAGALLIHVSCAELCRPTELPVPTGHALRLRPGASAMEAPLPPSAAREEAAQRLESTGTLLVQLPLSDTGWILEDRLDRQYEADLVRGRVLPVLALGAGFLLVIAGTYLLVIHKNRCIRQKRLDLRKNQLQLQAVLAATTDGIVVTDPLGRIELFNPAAEMMFGHLTEDVLSADVYKLLPDFFSSESASALIAGERDGKAAPLVRETRGRRTGGQDFPVRLWVSSVRFVDESHLLIVIQDLSEHEHNEEQLAFLEQCDVLTGLLNRKQFEHRLAVILAHEIEGAGPYVLCYIDVDQFKLVNDTCGHEAGDELLKQIAILFEAKLVGAEIIARLGSDEFGALFRDNSAEEAGKICDDFMQTVRNFLFTWRDQSFDVAVSAGMIEFLPETESASSVLSKADVACHMAKRHGRDRIHIYHEGDTELVRHHGDMRLVSTITHALTDGRFHLYAQPIVPIAPGSQHRHFEVLVRMVDENGNLVIPDDFIPAAERYILMPSVDRWIINHLFTIQAETLRAWHQTVPDTFLFAVNISGTSVTDEGFLRYLKRQFTDWDVPYQSICFELTETAAVRNLERARAFMEELAALGCSLALDDFGAGLSSYTYLRELPVDYLKIDGSFVRGMAEDPVNYALVESINQIGHVLGLRTIAEWAENKAIINQLRALNVDFAQGYGVGEPIPVRDLTLADTLIPIQTRRVAT